MEKIASFWISTTPHYVVLDEDNNLRFITTKLEEAEAKRDELNTLYKDDDYLFYVYELYDGLYTEHNLTYSRVN